MLSKLPLSIRPSKESEPSSLSSSPASSPVGQGVHPYNNLNLDSAPLLDCVSKPKDVYDTSLSWWRAAIRRRLVASVRRESRVIARMQVSYRLLRGAYRLSLIPFHIIGKVTYPMARRLFRLHFFSRHTYILHDCPSSHVFLRTS
jgi:hypothetical protein